MDKNNTLFLDTETTGVTDSDEILSIALVDAYENVLLDRYVTPTRVRAWPKAQAVNHISPEFIFSGGFPTLEELAPQILDIVRGKEVVAYGMTFDAQMLEANGIDLRLNASVHCCMNRFAIWNNQPSFKPYHVTGFKPVSLQVAANTVDYGWQGKPHTALADALACRFIWYWLDNNEQARDDNDLIVRL